VIVGRGGRENINQTGDLVRGQYNNEGSKQNSDLQSTHRWMFGDCAAWAAALVKKNPELRFAVEWHLEDPEEVEEMVAAEALQDSYPLPDYGGVDLNNYQQEWVAQHIYAHNDDHVYDARGVHSKEDLDDQGEETQIDWDQTFEQMESTGLYKVESEKDALLWINETGYSDKYMNTVVNNPPDRWVYGECAAWAIAAQRKWPYLKIGIEHSVPYSWSDALEDYCSDAQENEQSNLDNLKDAEAEMRSYIDPGSEGFESQTVSHVYLHDDNNAYDAQGVHPLPVGEKAHHSLLDRHDNYVHVLDADISDIYQTGLVNKREYTNNRSSEQSISDASEWIDETNYNQRYRISNNS
jgi:hypothetical protein